MVGKLEDKGGKLEDKGGKLEDKGEKLENKVGKILRIWWGKLEDMIMKTIRYGKEN